MENRQKGRFRKARWFLLIDAAVMLIIVLLAIILLRYRPSDYNPQPAFNEEVSPYLTNQLLPQFYNGMQKKEPFEILVEQKGLNEAITAIGWPQIFNNLIISTPAVAFDPKSFKMMAMVNYNSVDMVVTVEVMPKFDKKGLLNLEVKKVKMGALGITFVAKKIAQKMFDEQGQLIEPDNIASLGLASLLADKPFEPVFEVDGKKAKVDRIILEDQVVRIHIVPIEKSVRQTSKAVLSASAH